MAQCLENDAIGPPVEAAVFVRREQARMLEPKRARIVRLILSEKMHIVRIVAGSTAKEEFIELRKKFFRDYFRLVSMLSNSFSITEPSVRDIAVREAFQGVTRLLESEGSAKLSPENMAEAKFCVDTLRRAYRLVGIIHKHDSLSEGKWEVDQKLALNFNATAIFSEFNLDCLLLMLMHRESVDSEILNATLEGMRNSVMAYSFARQGVQLRQELSEIPIASMVLDDEDNELLEESYLELGSESRLNVEQ